MFYYLDEKMKYQDYDNHPSYTILFKRFVNRKTHSVIGLDDLLHVLLYNERYHNNIFNKLR